MSDRYQRSVLLVTAILASSTPAFAPDPPQPAPQPPPPPQQNPAPQPTPPPATPEPEPPGILSGAASGAYERRDSFPSVNIYVPEGQASVRIRKLIKNVLFESQIDYRYVNGDISTFLRHHYHSRNSTPKP